MTSVMSFLSYYIKYWEIFPCDYAIYYVFIVSYWLQSNSIYIKTHGKFHANLAMQEILIGELFRMIRTSWLTKL